MAEKTEPPRTPFPRRGGWTAVCLALLAVLLVGACSEVLPGPYEYSTIEVQAVRRNGDPIPGVELVLYDWQRHMAYGTTGADGRHVFSHVPEGLYGVGMTVPDEYELLPRETPFTQELRVADGEARSVSFTLLKLGDGTVRVRTLTADGTPLPQVSLALFSFRGEIAQGRSDSLGNHVFTGVPTGEYGVRAFPVPGYRLAVPFVEGVLVEEGSDERLNFTLERCVGTVRVRAADAAGQPLAGVRVELYTFRGPLAEGETNAEGYHDFPIDCGIEYGVRVRPSGEFLLPSGLPGHRDGITATNGTVETVAFQLRPCRGTILVRVVDVAGAPASGASLVLYTATREVATVTTDAQGRYAFGPVPCGEYGVRVAPTSAYSSEMTRGAGFMDGIRVEEGSERSVGLRVERR